jgi:hypothetical protein
VVTLDTTGAVLERRSICTHPRGIAYDAHQDVVHVACAGGQLVTLPAAGGAPVRQLTLDSDLRDVVVDGDHLLVSRFRKAEVLIVETDGHLSSPMSPPSVSLATRGPSAMTSFSPAVAWRMIAAPGGGALVAFQEEQTSEVQPSAGGYGGSCGGIVRTGVSMLRSDGTTWTVTSLPTVLPVDLAVSPSGDVQVISASTGVSTTGNALAAAMISVKPPPPSPTPVDGGRCSAQGTSFNDGSPFLRTQFEGQLVAIAYDTQGNRIVQTREPYRLLIERTVDTQAVNLPGESRADTGHELFHFGTEGDLACASCHPEGREDGHLWTFAQLGPRRTQSIGGGILGTEPFHWNGDMTDFNMLAHDVFGSRMSGPQLVAEQVEALAHFVDRIPAMTPDGGLDGAALERGRALFQNPTIGCATCHAGDKMTNNATVDVGTGGQFQVPSLMAVGWRAPYLHSGCAPTLEARFGDCGGGDLHGHTSALSNGDRSDLVSFLKSL